eukprot:TRINITY_DN10154_c0_g1_i2.p1 TRINITY_DN10154_c0_g1~~TRINITY_DN10154_c0_g1_i2.p1  ORF type:complete len:210 (+),score=5.76 TRINITY_DN10154_c0_g1_i2:117-746(+)
MAASSHNGTRLSAFHRFGNLSLVLFISLPAFVLFYFFHKDALRISATGHEMSDALYDQKLFDSWRGFCRWGLGNPIPMVALIFFINVNVLFWLISLVQGSTWLIDVYWTIIPVMIAHFYAAHPLASANPMRSRVTLALTWLWSLRLTHSYLRREGWQLGAREDWRFEDLRNQHGRNWWWTSFFYVYVSQELTVRDVYIRKLRPKKASVL